MCLFHDAAQSSKALARSENITFHLGFSLGLTMAHLKIENCAAITFRYPIPIKI
jgi:hypothetical protein